MLDTSSIQTYDTYSFLPVANIWCLMVEVSDTLIICVLLTVVHGLLPSFFITSLQWVVWSSQRTGRWLQLLVHEVIVFSFSAAMAL